MSKSLLVKRVARRYVPTVDIFTVLAMRICAAITCYAASLAIEPLNKPLNTMAHIFALMAIMAILSWIERVTADHVKAAARRVISSFSGRS